MRSCLRLCGELGVNALPHPGFVDRENFGRKEMPISFSDLVSLIESQAGGLEQLADEEKLRSPTSSSMARFTMLSSAIAGCRLPTWNSSKSVSPECGFSRLQTGA